ncbi:MAG: phenylalanine--tRNA ligase subunit alpha, partial [Pyrobaculum sp.]
MLVLPPTLYEIIKRAEDWRLLDDIAAELGVPPESLMRYVEEGRAKGLLDVKKETEVAYVLTDEGRVRAVEGLPEYKLLKSAECS